jgi:lysosomal Pro-X carboxypeptidase
MKEVVLLLFIAFSFGIRFPPRSPYVRELRPEDISADYETNYFTQTLDHFDFMNTATYQQKYLISTKYWGQQEKENTLLQPEVCKGPIFFYTGNEGAIELFWANTGFVTDYLAPKYGAMIIFGEHRYYGASMPFGNESFTGTNPKYLTSEQALADYATLIPALKDQYGAQACPVVAFGGSYGGMLTGWFRLKYPNVVVGGIAASAPVLQFNNTGVSQWIFNEISTNDFKEAGCSDNIRSAFDTIIKTGNDSNGLNFLTQKFKLCSPLQQGMDLANWIASGLQYLAMIDYPYPTNFLNPVPAWPVQATCAAMNASLETNPDLLQAFAAGIAIYYNYTGQTPCYNLYSTATADLGTLGWAYQSCNEMVMPIGSNGTTDMYFPAYWDYDANTQFCQQTWGITPRNNWVTEYYGGDWTPNGPNIVGSNIVWSNGRLDPWSGGGVLQDVSDTHAIFIHDGAHHLDLRAPNKADPSSVIKARLFEELQIVEWIQSFNK